MAQIIPLLRQALEQCGEVTFWVPDPDLGRGYYAGELTAAGIHRPLQSWIELADALEAHCLLPQQVTSGAGLVRLCFMRYAPAPAPDAAGYSPNTDWVRVNKLEDPTFVLTLTEALRRVNPPEGGRVLALGVNAGHELAALALAFGERRLEVIGIDLDAAALDVARLRYPAAEFRVLDINELSQVGLAALGLGQFDLILALSLLQSPGIRQDVLLAALKPGLTAGGGLVLGYPNARYRDGVLSYGARMRNFARPDLSLLMSDVTDARRRLQKYGFKVFVTGKYEVLVTAIPAERQTPVNLTL